MAFVVVNKEKGIYIGPYKNIGAWSLLNKTYQDVVIAYPNKKEALLTINSVEKTNNLGDFEFIEVKTGNVGCATVKELQKAGLGHMLGFLDPLPELTEPASKVLAWIY